MHNILEYLIIIIQIVGFGVLLIKIGIFIGKVQSELLAHEKRIRNNEMQIKIICSNFDKHLIER